MLRASSLRGYRIPGIEQRLITTLFADDTTVYLSHLDNYSDLTTLLQKWCIASTARFNLNKTEIIPIGKPTYRAQLIASRQMNDNALPLPPGIHIATEGEAVRSLGAWIGNNTDTSVPWTRVVNRIVAALDRWSQCHPSKTTGRPLIIQMIVGGMTQYLAKVQGTPPAIEKKLMKIIRDFMWGPIHTPPINSKTLSLPREQGGLKVLDIQARNEAIQLT
ncbi:hypothetical protein BV25DRAFT_1784342, partial [Artomyces pyxidatus]